MRPRSGHRARAAPAWPRGPPRPAPSPAGAAAAGPVNVNTADAPTLARELTGVGKSKAEAIVAHRDKNGPYKGPDKFPPYPYDHLDAVERYLQPTLMGTRTAVHQGAIGCRYRCTFCGVVSVYNGLTHLQGGARLAEAVGVLRDRYGANGVQYYDNNFFDSEPSAVPLLEAIASTTLPWWCYARADTMAGFSARTWALVRRSRLRMAYKKNIYIFYYLIDYINYDI